ncbi:MAG TPA: alpha/beta hydrolase-fold protein [Frankiaceae bacterium]|jgi:S-formylglutathione hydrolase FrmB|nr:alpha/beta hydrolase-fold protein [Frankiaceae bacterium]
MSFDDITLISGSTPIIIVVLGLGATLLSFRWKDGVWKQQLLYGLPITLALVGLTALLVDGLALIPYQFPNSYYLWVGLVFLAVLVAIIGWTRFRNWRRVVSVLSVVLAAAMAGTLINKQYQYYPTVGSLFGVDAQNQVSLKQLEQIRAKARADNGGSLPTHGFTIEIPIPGTKSHFVGRSAFVWVPPIWVADEKVKLPVIVLLAGIPGQPSDWTRASMADVTARAFADAHHGMAPIIVMPDENGSFTNDTECVNSPRGQSETYITEDVPDFMRKNFNAQTTKGSLAIAGLSEGGFCSLMLTLRHPDEFVAFGEYSGLTSPTVEEGVDPAATIPVLFGGSQTAYNQHDPLYLLRNQRFPKTAGWFEVGTADHVPLLAQRALVPLSSGAGILTCSKEVAGAGHTFTLWEQAFQDSLPFLSWRLGLTPKPDLSGASCSG